MLATVRRTQRYFVRAYATARHSSLLPKAWILSDGNPTTDLKAICLAKRLDIEYEFKQVKNSSLPLSLQRFVVSTKGLLSANSFSCIEADPECLPRIVIGGSANSYLGCLEVLKKTRNRAFSIYLGLPPGSERNIDTLVMSRLDTMKLQSLGPARANLENAIKTLVPFTGAIPENGPETNTDVANDDITTVCIGSGLSDLGYAMHADEFKKFLTNLQTMPDSINTTLHVRMSTKMPSKAVQLTSQYLPNAKLFNCKESYIARDEVIRNSSRIIASADDIWSIATAISLNKPVYVFGEERTTGTLRNYYRILDDKNLIRRFYPKESKYSYMLMPDIENVDPLSATRDHEPWVKYDTARDLEDIAAFIRGRFDLLND